MLSITFCFKAFLPKSKAILISLLFGFVLIGGELCLYLLRQLLSTGLVFIGLGFLFRNQPFKGLAIGLCGLFFHSTTIVYLPLFISGFFSNKINKTLIIVGGYIILFLLVSNFQLGSTAILNVTGTESLYYSKYQIYTSFSGQKGWRDQGSMGLLTLAMLLYFASLNLWNRLFFLKSKLWLFYFFSLVIVTFQISLEIFRLFWISSRFNFIADPLLLISNVLITYELLPKSYNQLIFCLVSIAVFTISVYVIIQTHESYGLYNFPL